MSMTELDKKLNYDKELNIAVGSSRHTKVWKNKTTKWSELVRRMSRTTRTRETYNEYKRMNRNQKQEVKDVGGFVGGMLKKGRRKSEYVANRSLVTLDADFADSSLWPHLEMLFENALVMYSTHSHSPDNMKVRLVIPLERPVKGDEYKALSRFVAAEIGIDLFDDTTYQPERLMFWPSTAEDGEFIFKYIDGPFLDPDEIFERYPNWQDMSTWPESSRAPKIHQRYADKQGNPLEKPGVVGAFNRAYNIHEVIDKYLSDIYEPCVADDRYTYKKGTASAGVITYDDMFAFSHHGTDPISGMLCNAFDLVRIHKFGIKDEDAREDITITKLPSYKAMVEFAGKDDKVKEEFARVAKEQIKEDFSDDPEVDTKWIRKLKYSGQGKLLPTLVNLIMILKNDPNLKGIVLNELNDYMEIIEPVPWARPDNYKMWRDKTDEAQLISYIESTYGAFPLRHYETAITKVSDDRSYHPIKQYLENLPKWDGVRRVDKLLVDYLGVEDCEYVREVTRKTLLGAVKRVYHPGIKFDWMLVIGGPQGIGKSTLVKRLAGEWFNDSLRLSDARDKTAAEKIKGYWILEIGELAGMRKTDESVLKNWLSSQVDVYREAYGSKARPHPRQCVFVGTTNEDNYLRDVTGNRRFWPVKARGGTKAAWDITDEEVKQIWAEVLEIEKEGERLELPGHLEAVANEMQKGAVEIDERQGIIEEYLNMLLPKSWDSMDLHRRLDYIHDYGNEDSVIEKGTVKRTEVCIMEIWQEALGKRPADLDRSQSIALGKILRQAGWESERSSKRLPIYGPVKVFTKK